MKRAWSEIRCYIAELLLYAAVGCTPPNSAEEGAMCQAALKYFELIRPMLDRQPRKPK